MLKIWWLGCSSQVKTASTCCQLGFNIDWCKLFGTWLWSSSLADCLKSDVNFGYCCHNFQNTSGRMLGVCASAMASCHGLGCLGIGIGIDVRLWVIVYDLRCVAESHHRDGRLSAVLLAFCSFWSLAAGVTSSCLVKDFIRADRVGKSPLRLRLVLLAGNSRSREEKEEKSDGFAFLAPPSLGDGLLIVPLSIDFVEKIEYLVANVRGVVVAACATDTDVDGRAVIVGCVAVTIVGDGALADFEWD